ncbi:MAG: hypothetical protein ACRDJU_08450 [Actinomycetota bacterium]
MGRRLRGGGPEVTRPASKIAEESRFGAWAAEVALAAAPAWALCGGSGLAAMARPSSGRTRRVRGRR